MFNPVSILIFWTLNLLHPEMAASGSTLVGPRPGNNNNNWRKNVLCRFFMADGCRAGIDCPFSHDRSISNRGTIPCKYFSQGTCANGNNCRFSHEPVRRVAAPVQISDDDVSPHFQTLSRFPGDDESGFGTDTSWAEAPEFVPRSAGLPSEDGSYFFSTFSDHFSNEESWNHTSDTISPNGFSRLHPETRVMLDTSSSQGPKSWAHVVNPIVMAEMTVADAESQLCPFYVLGECRYNEHCSSIHGDICDLCGKAALHPTHQRQRKQHFQACMSQHEVEMELAFAVARSKDKTCGICMEVIMDKPKSEARFGIMPSCNHCFCLTCLRKWRQAKQFEHKIIRACPECRQTSDYVCPSRYWVDTKEEKAKLLSDYKDALNKKECKYFQKGQGECPFGNKCFYRHENPDGTLVDIGPPPRRPRRQNADGEPESIRTYLLYNFFEQRDDQNPLSLSILDFLEFFSSPDSDDSDGDMFM